MKNIILCGGTGTRLWPISRTLMPKQFVKLFNEKSLFQMTVERNKSLCDTTLIVSNVDQYFLAIDQLEEIKYNFKDSKFLLETIGRNTAPAIALACFSLDYEDIVLVTPSDHLIKNEKEYIRVLKIAEKLASEGNIVTFGITAKYPETGFGYIEGKKSEEKKEYLEIEKFHEKPNLETAIKYINDGNYFWNSGMFCFKAGIFLEELEKYSKEVYNFSKIAFEKKNMIADSQFKIKKEDMLEIPSISVDYAVMEKSDKVKVIPSDISWSDVGSFDSLAEEIPNDINNNFILSKKHTELIDVEDLIVVDTEDALLISKKGSSQKIKERVEKLKKENSSLTETHTKVYRPWGSYEILVESPTYKVKRIEVKPGKRLSLQKHFHRNEHWIVVSGTATVRVGKEEKILRPNESTYIKMGEEHRLSNEGKIPVIIIEAQVGEYTGEDDIVRIEDDFDRR